MWREIIKHMGFVEKGFQTKGTVLVIHPSREPSALFFLQCLFIHKFNWSLRKSLVYFKAVLPSIALAPSASDFLGFFEKEIERIKKTKLNDEWKPTEADVVECHTYLNSLKHSKELQADPELSEDEGVRARRKPLRRKTKRATYKSRRSKVNNKRDSITHECL